MPGTKHNTQYRKGSLGNQIKEPVAFWWRQQALWHEKYVS